jgi:chromosome segregation ATPase
MGSYTDSYMEALNRDLQYQYRRLFEVGEELAQAKQSLESKDEELTAARRRLNLQMDTTAQVEKKLADALGVLSDRDIEIERLTFALKDSDNELKSIRSNYENRIDELMTEIERLTRTNKKRVKVVELRWLLDGHTDVLDEHRTAILQVREAVDQNKETLSAAQREMLATLDRHGGLISKAFACIDNHSDSIYKQQQSIDALLSAIENQPKTKDDLWTYIRRQMNQQGVGGNNEGEEAR